jgi:hypothetical protein
VKLRIATCLRPDGADIDPDVDEAPLGEALEKAGIEATLVPWDDPAADWDAPIPTLIRSTWNYALDVEKFLAWTARVSATSPLWNPPAIVQTNVHKRYLLDLEARGVPIVPTILARTLDVAPPWERFVVKPEVGAGSLDTRVFDEGDASYRDHLHHILRRCPALVQPYVRSVDGYGERSLIWIDGEITHAIRKTARFTGDPEQIDGPMPIADDERAIAMAALAPFASQIMYGRVDLARDDAGKPMVMELELVEPSLFFLKHPPALDRFVARLLRELGA